MGRPDASAAPTNTEKRLSTAPMAEVPVGGLPVDSMTSSNATSVLLEIVRLMKARASSCERLDLNVCAFEPDPSNVVKVIITRGEPFIRQTTFVKEGQRVRLYANQDFLTLWMPHKFDVDPISINKRDMNFFLKPAGELVAGRTHEVFAGDGVLSSDQKAFLGDAALLEFVKSVNLAGAESIHFHRNGMSIYLSRPSFERTCKSIDLACAFLRYASTLVTREVELELRTLPPSFHPLIPLIRAWGISDDAEREERRSQVSKEALQRLVDEVKLYFGVINSYLNSFGDQQSDAATALGALAEFAAETDLYLKKGRN
jgi:hypothetical protein